MNNNWVLIVVIVLSLSSCNFFGGKKKERWSPEQMVDRETKMMIETLDLTGQQIQEVTRINGEMAREMATFRKSAKGDREQMRAGMTELVNRKDENLKEVLTEEQFKLYKESEQDRRQKGMRDEPRRNREER